MTIKQKNMAADLAVGYLTERGLFVVGRDVRPCERDARCVIDVIMRTDDRKSVVFVAVKWNAKRPKAAKAWAFDRRARNLQLRACTNWILKNRWRGNFRFDVVNIYGDGGEGAPVEIDHIEDAPLFPPKWRFW